jgi:DNA (cytosine-5)-methyltransferase 1
VKKIISLFSGCGAMDLGFKQAGFKTILANDLLPIACDSLEKNKISEKIICGNVKNIDFKKYHGVVDGLIGGPPCQPYSQTRHYLTNKKGGFEDKDNGFTVYEYLRALKEISPKFFLFENVDGFFYKTHEAEFNYFIKHVKLFDYDVNYKVLNTANYGIPQTRKRFICVGFKKPCSKFSFPEETHTGDIEKKPNLLPWVTCKESIGDFDNVLKKEKIKIPGGKHKDLFIKIPPGDNYLYFTEKRGCKNPEFKWKSKYWTFLLKLSPNRPSWTIQASFSQNQGPFHWKNRFLRIEEIKRLQTIDDEYEILGNFKEQWKQIGNAFPSKMAKILANQIKIILGG